MYHELANETIETLGALYAAKGAGIPADAQQRTTVTLDQIYTAPKVFQPRDRGLDVARYDAHIASLVSDIKRHNKPLRDINVFPIDGRLFCCDGHCRIEAYVRAQWHRPIGAEFVRGSFEQAIDFAFKQNSKDKLSLLEPEKKGERAWRLVLVKARNPLWAPDGKATEDPHSVRGIAQRTGVSPNTVWNMITELRTARPFNHYEHTWREVKRLRNAKRPEFQATPPEKREELINAIGADVLRKEPEKYFRRYVAKEQQPKRGVSKEEKAEILADAVRKYLPRVYAVLEDQILSDNESESEAPEESDF